MRRHITARLDLSRTYRPIRPGKDEPKARSVTFASPAAEKAADEAGLTTEQLAGQEFTGATGFTVSDVRRILDAQG